MAVLLFLWCKFSKPVVHSADQDMLMTPGLPRPCPLYTSNSLQLYDALEGGAQQDARSKDSKQAAAGSQLLDELRQRFARLVCQLKCLSTSNKTQAGE